MYIGSYQEFRTQDSLMSCLIRLAITVKDLRLLVTIDEQEAYESSF